MRVNNVRLLWDPTKRFQCCSRHQLATAEEYLRLVLLRGHESGALYRAKRGLSDFSDPVYPNVLRHSFEEAAGILVVNPLIAESVKPFARAVYGIPSGFDENRFSLAGMRRPTEGPMRILFAGLTDEPMKGFAVLRQAAELLWSRRKDFVVQPTSAAPEMVYPWERYLDWQTQAALPELLSAADIIACPMVAEEALGRTAVEGMAAGRPVVAGRIDSILFTVLDEATGLLCEPGNPVDLTRQLESLQNGETLRQKLGAAGRQRFETHYTCPVIIDRHYHPLFGGPILTY